MYNATRGAIQTPKHFLLPYAVKTLTRNKEIIQFLCRLGHGRSYPQLEENDTALCLHKINLAENESTILNTGLKSQVFTNLAWDNIDRLEETLSGKGTTHRVNGISVQTVANVEHEIPDIEILRISKSRQRKINVELPT